MVIFRQGRLLLSLAIFNMLVLMYGTCFHLFIANFFLDSSSFVYTMGFHSSVVLCKNYCFVMFLSFSWKIVLVYDNFEMRKKLLCAHYMRLRFLCLDCSKVWMGLPGYCGWERAGPKVSCQLRVWLFFSLHYILLSNV